MENNLKMAYKDAMYEIQSSEEETEKVLSLYESVSTENTEKVSRKRFGMPKAAVAALVLTCVLALGGGAVWAMTASSLKDFLFGSSSEESFASIYNEIGKEYKIGSHTITFDGVIYDKSVNTSYVSFSAVDEEGNPTNFEILKDEKGKHIDKLDVLPNCPRHELIGKINVHPFKLGKDAGYIITEYSDGAYGKYLKPTLYLSLTSEEEHYGGKKTIGLMVLDQQGIEDLNAEFGKLDPSVYVKYDPETNKPVYGENRVDRTTILPEVQEILDRFGMKELECTTAPSQVIEAENCTFIFGRTDCILRYNYDEIDFDQFYIIRENGEKISVKKEMTGDKGLTFLHAWFIEGADKHKTYPRGNFSEKKHTCEIQFKYNFILTPDEKVSIEINGQIYK